MDLLLQYLTKTYAIHGDGIFFNKTEEVNSGVSIISELNKIFSISEEECFHKIVWWLKDYGKTDNFVNSFFNDKIIKMICGEEVTYFNIEKYSVESNYEYVGFDNNMMMGRRNHELSIHLKLSTSDYDVRIMNRINKHIRSYEKFDMILIISGNYREIVKTNYLGCFIKEIKFLEQDEIGYRGGLLDIEMDVCFDEITV